MGYDREYFRWCAQPDRLSLQKGSVNEIIELGETGEADVKRNVLQRASFRQTPYDKHRVDRQAPRSKTTLFFEKIVLPFATVIGAAHSYFERQVAGARHKGEASIAIAPRTIFLWILFTSVDAVYLRLIVFLSRTGQTVDSCALFLHPNTQAAL